LKNIIQILCTCEVKLIRWNTKCNANTWRSEFILSHKSLHILFKSYFITKQVLLKLLWIKSLNKIYFYYVCEMINNDIKNCKLKKSIHIWHTKACIVWIFSPNVISVFILLGKLREIGNKFIRVNRNCIKILVILLYIMYRNIKYLELRHFSPYV